MVRVLIFGLLVGGVAVAQESGLVTTPPVPLSASTVSGRVLLADTNGPARFSKVLLKSVAPSEVSDESLGSLLGESKDDKKTKLTADEQADRDKTRAASRKFMAALGDMLVSATVAEDGTYVFTNVKPGSYYVHGQAPGYIDAFRAFSAEDLASKDPDMKAKVAAAVPVVTVTATSSGRADLRLERGGAIAGRVLYDDGTAAAGWTVRTVHPVAASEMGSDLGEIDLAHATESGTTDDTGAFRITGLPSGEYVLKAQLVTSPLGHSSFNALAGAGAFAEMQGLKLTVFSGNALRQAEAKAIDVRAGDTVAGYEMTMPLHQLHSISGMVRAKSDGHPVSGGTVELTGQDAAGKEDASVHLVAGIRADGTFRFDYVTGPATYLLKTSKAIDATTTGTMKVLGSTVAEQKTSHSYGAGTATAVVGDGDLSEVKVEVPERVVK